MAASFSVKRGDSRCHRSEIIQSASVRGDLSCLSIHRTDCRDVIFVKKNSKPYKTDCGSVTNGDLLRRMNNRELADVIGFFARWMQRADIGKDNYSEYMLRWLSSLGTPGDAGAKSRHQSTFRAQNGARLVDM